MNRGPDGRILPGHTGNAGGRPIKPTASDRMFEEIFSAPMVVKRNGVEIEVTGEEALHLRSVEQAMKRKSGSRAIRLVLKWIIERQVARVKQTPRKVPKREWVYIRERDSDNAFEAMCLLGIAVPNPDSQRRGDSSTLSWDEEMPIDYSRILLTRQAIQEALSRAPELPDDPDFSFKMTQHTASDGLQ